MNAEEVIAEKDAHFETIVRMATRILGAGLTRSGSAGVTLNEIKLCAQAGIRVEVDATERRLLSLEQRVADLEAKP